MHSCIYCKMQYSKNTEHVFPLGLGGENIMIDCVCDKCNNEFSKLERELYQKSPVALIRSNEGVIGNKSRNTVSAFKAPLLLCQDDSTGIAYEVGQSEKMQVYLRPQIIQINNIFYVQAEHQDHLNALLEKCKDWKSDNLRIILKFPDSELSHTEYVQITKIENSYFCEKIEGQLKVKNEIILRLLPVSHQLYNSFHERIYIDELKKLSIRARTQQAAIRFIIELLEFSDTKKHMTSYVCDTENLKIVSVGFNFNSKKCEQALVKIALNSVFHYYPNSRDKTVIEPYLNFVKTGDKTFASGIERKDLFLDSKENSHNIYLYQSESFLSIRLSLFNGQFVYQFLIPGLGLFESDSAAKVIIDYKLKKNYIYNQI